MPLSTKVHLFWFDLSWSSSPAWKSRMLYHSPGCWKWQNSLWWLWHDWQPDAGATVFSKCPYRWPNININSTFYYITLPAESGCPSDSQTDHSWPAKSHLGIRVTRLRGQSDSIRFWCILWSKYVITIFLISNNNKLLTKDSVLLKIRVKKKTLFEVNLHHSVGLNISTRNCFSDASF